MGIQPVYCVPVSVILLTGTPAQVLSFLTVQAFLPSLLMTVLTLKQPLFNEHIVFTLNHDIGLYPNAGQWDAV